MGRIVRKKKGRPAKVDTGRRGMPTSDREPRRSSRRRSVKYMFELDDYLDELGIFEDDEDQQRREKELKLLLNVESKGTGGAQPESAGPKPGHLGRRVNHQGSPSSSFSSDVDLPSKKRKMNEGIDGATYEDDCNDDHVEFRERKPELKAKILAPGPQTRAAPFGVPLPDKKILELILNIIQRKDIYGVFAEPVDPEELPDYHGVIKNPMDFATVRNKLSDGSYTTMEQIESDVYLICSNAMQYNAPDTIYYKQARGMHELAKRKFYELSLNSHSSEKKSKYDQNVRSSSILNRKVKRPVPWIMQEPAGFDLPCGATIGDAVDINHVSNALLAVGPSRPSSGDPLAERNSFLNDNNFDKGEALLPGNSSLSKPGRKLPAGPSHDDDQRATYEISLTHPLASSESLFSTFEGESKQLIPVGAYAEHSYARSLARFVAALGPVAWKISSKRIEQALPQEVKYGRGWVGEYEPLAAPVLLLENCTVMEPPFFSKKLSDDPRKFEKIPTVPFSLKEIQGTMPFLEKNLHSVGPAKIRPTSAPMTSPMKAQADRENVSEVKASFFLAPCSKPSTSANLNRHHEKSGSKNAGESEQGLKQVELNGPPVFNKNAVDFIGQGHISKGSEVEVSRSIFTSRDVNFTSSGSVELPDVKEVSVGGLPNGNVVGDRIDSNTVACSSSDLAKGLRNYPQEQGQGLSERAHLMRLLAEKAQNQQKMAYPSSSSSLRVLSRDLNRDNLNNTITAVSHALSVGAGGFRPVGENTNLFKNQHANFLNISTRDMHSQESRFREGSPASVIHYRPDRSNSPLSVFLSQGVLQPMRIGNDVHFQTQPMEFPPFPPNSKQMLDSRPPDLNVGFQSPGSPGKNPYSGGLVESQQPDLALQL